MKQLILKDGDIVTIRKGKKSDAEAVLKYINTISKESDYLTFGEGEFDITIEQEEYFIDNISKQKNALFIIAEIEGMVIANLNFSGGSRSRIIHTGEFGVSVLKDYWGQGIGTELIKFLIEWGQQSKVIRKINLRVRSDNFSAINIYKKLGFKEEGIITREFLIKNKSYDSICMGLNID